VADLLLELFSEEIPARMQEDALVYLQKALLSPFMKIALPAIDLSGLSNASQSFEIHSIPSIGENFVTPRRLAVWVKNLPEKQSDISTELKGPKVDAPEAALQGFLKKSGLKLEQLEQRDGVYFATVHQKGKPTAVALKTIIEHLLANFPWPKSMRWGAGEVTWVRPLHSILCIFDGKIVPVEFGGVKAGNTTRGHRFLAPKEITISKPQEYEAALEKAFVIADRDKRKAEILKQAEKVAASKSFAIKKDEALLDEVTGLVEWPVVLVGSIDAKFMDLPPEVLSTVMKKHQKYFALEDKAEKLAPHFLITGNMEAKDGRKAIIAGNERVLRARFSDARFFWDQDRKKPLAEWAVSLKDVTFHAKLGTVADKVARIKTLAVQLTDCIKADKKLVERAAELCKADLVTGMVGEFAELQGIMGRYYALQQKEDAFVADAIREHYKPQGPNDSVPHTPVSICIALADKLDTLVSMFAIGEKPTGSKDPFALRRAALGVIRIVLDNNLRLPLKSCFAAPPAAKIALYDAQQKLAAKLHEAPHKVGKYLTVNETAFEDLGDAVPANLTGMLYDFFIDRLKVQLKDSGIRHDVISAVVADGDDDLVRIVARAKAVQDFIGTDDGKNLLAGYKRAANILAIEEKKDKTTYDAADLDAAALKEPEEIGLIFVRNPKEIEKIEQFINDEQFIDLMKWLASLRPPIDLFFDKILVNDKTKGDDVRANRLCLLATIKGSMDYIANFGLIEG